MGTLKLVLKEMSEAKVSFISLVPRGANRIPWRIVKSDKESEMIDLGNLKRVLKGEPKPDTERKEPTLTPEAAPVVVGVVVMDHGQETLDTIQKTLKEHGFSAEKATKNEDGTVLFHSEDLPEGDTSIVRLSEDMALVVKGFSPYSEALSASADFSDVVKARGFYSGMNTAMDALNSAVSTALYKAESPADASRAVKSVLEKFTTYVTTLAGGLPTAAFKAETVVADVVKSSKEKMKDKDAKGDGMACPKGVKPEDWAAMSEDDKKAWKAKHAAKGGEGEVEDADDSSATNQAVDSTGGAPAAEGAPTTGAAEKSEADGMKEVLAQLASISEAVKTMAGEVSSVAKEQKNLEGRVDEIARKAETATQAIKSTVVVGASAGDEPAPSTSVSKSEQSDPRTGCFDTAFIPRSKLRR